MSPCIIHRSSIRCYQMLSAINSWLTLHLFWVVWVSEQLSVSLKCKSLECGRKLGYPEKAYKNMQTLQATVAQIRLFWTYATHVQFCWLNSTNPVFSNLNQATFVCGPKLDMFPMFCNVISLSKFTCAEKTSYILRSTRLFSWTTVFIPINVIRMEIDLLMDLYVLHCDTHSFSLLV